MSEMTSNKCSGTPIISLSVAVLAILVALLAWLFSGFIRQQNENLTTNIVATRQQVEATTQQLNNLIQLLGQYLQRTGDPNVDRKSVV
jgi:predicted PurR-regulated permease PerM